MARKATARQNAADPPASDHRPAGRNPRNRPVHDMHDIPPQPAAPEQSAIDEQQDQQPMHSEPLLNPPNADPAPQREIKNG
jgi:hypothetical protein